MHQDDSIWDIWWLDGFSTIDRITTNKREKKKNEYTKRSNKKYMGEI